MTPILAQTSWLIPLYPLIGAVLTIPWSPAMIRKTGPRPAGYINIVMTFWLLPTVCWPLLLFGVSHLLSFSLQNGCRWLI
jgi:hypothetical protein